MNLKNPNQRSKISLNGSESSNSAQANSNSFCQFDRVRLRLNVVLMSFNIVEINSGEA